MFENFQDPQSSLLYILVGFMIFWVMRKPIMARIYGVKFISINTAYDLYQKKQNKAVFLDVRTPWETSTQPKIKKSKFIPLSELNRQIAKLKTNLINEPIIIICHSGRRAVTAGIKMKKAGFKEVSVMRGGISAWSRAQYPLSKGK